MVTHIHLDEDMQTTCLFCSSVFRITQQQLDQARGKVRCGICGEDFNALLTLESYHGEPVHPLTRSPNTGQPDNTASESGSKGSASGSPEAPKTAALPAKEPAREPRPVSLQDAMLGAEAERHGNRQWLWGLGIALLLALLVVQTVYYLRYRLIANPDYQHQVLSLCRLLPCDPNRFHSPQQVRLTERNVFTHPTRKQALMISGRFVNQAPFPQTPPRLRISLSDLQGNLVANRLFEPREYLADPTLKRLQPGKSVPFRLEIHDPDEKALTYEFDFVS